MTPARFSLVLVALGAVTVLVGACSEETIVLATVPAEDAGTPHGKRCTTNDDCSQDGFCEKVTCDAPAGECRRRPTLCAQEQRPTCGCDGITYLDDCLRRAAGVSSSTPGECDASALRCSATQACPAGATCALLAMRDFMCSPDLAGVCWVIPAVCPPPVTGDRWDPCAPGPGPRCVGTCEAIAAGVPFRRAGRCP